MKVNITRRIQFPEKGWRFLSVIRNLNGTIKGDWVLVNGKEERHPEHGRFYIDYLQDGKRVRRAAGSTPAEAMETATRQEKLLAAHRAASAAGLVIPIETDTATGRSLRLAVDDYLAEIKAHKKRKTYLAYRT